MTAPTPHDRERLAAYILAICAPLLDRSDELAVYVEDDDVALARYGCPPGTGCLFVIKAPPDQVGYLLGKGGSTAESVRHLVRCWAAAQKWRLRVDARVRSR